MRQYLSILFFLLLTLSGYAQSAKQADELFNAREYAEARAIYDALLRKQPTNPLYIYRSARCAQELGDLAAAARREPSTHSATSSSVRSIISNGVCPRQ